MNFMFVELNDALNLLDALVRGVGRFLSSTSVSR